MENRIIEVVREKLADSFAMDFPVMTRREAILPGIPGKAHAVIGMRRAGKTWFLLQCLADRLAAGTPREMLVYFNFEDERLGALQKESLGSILEEYYRRFPEFRRNRTVTFCFDEIQTVRIFIPAASLLRKKPYWVSSTTWWMPFSSLLFQSSADPNGADRSTRANFILPTMHWPPRSARRRDSTMATCWKTSWPANCPARAGTWPITEHATVSRWIFWPLPMTATSIWSKSVRIYRSLPRGTARCGRWNPRIRSTLPQAGPCSAWEIRRPMPPCLPVCGLSRSGSGSVPDPHEALQQCPIYQQDSGLPDAARGRDRLLLSVYPSICGIL